MPGIDEPRLILGGPGCGKTTRLLRIVAEKLVEGVRPEAIAFVSFTRESVREAKERAALQFGLDPAEDLPWFRTIHSMAYARLKLGRDEVMQERDWIEFSEVVGEQISSVTPSIDGLPSGTPGDKMIRVMDYAATTMLPIRTAWEQMNEVVEWSRMDRFDRALRRYKADTGKMDFNDMLAHYAASGDPVPARIVFIDEAQDLTRAQWAVARRAFAEAEEVYVGGDDDQAIYRWAGADVETFLRLSTAPEVLPHSHRLPRKVFRFASRLAERISTRYTKQFDPVDKPGSIELHTRLDFVDTSSGSWLLLARNNYQLQAYEAFARAHGYTYATRRGASVRPQEVEAMKLWERVRGGRQDVLSAEEVRSLVKAMDGVAMPQLRELTQYPAVDLPEQLRARLTLPWYEALDGIALDRRDYYAEVLRRRADKLSKPPRLRIDTIHGVKGAEADHVLISPDMSDRTMKSYHADPDAEHRVFYVGVTRARESLHLLTATQFNHYDWPPILR